MRRRLLALAAVVALAGALAGACGGDDTGGPLAETADNLAEVSSGTMVLRLTAAAGTTGDGGDVGFELRGPFDLDTDDDLPEAALTYSRLAGPRKTSTTFVSKGGRAWVVTDGGDARELPAEDVDALRQERGDDGGFGTLDLDGWAEDERVSDGGEVDGVAVDKVTGTVDPVRALNDVFGLAGSLGAGEESAGPIEGDDAERLRELTKSATYEVLTGKEDRLLRSLRVDLTFAGPAKIGRFDGARMRLLLELSRPNQPVRIEAP